MAKSFLRRSSRKRQQSDIPCLLDRRRQTVLMRCADTSQAPRHNLSALRDKLPQQTVVLVVNVFDLLDAELAYFLAPEELAAASAAFAGTTWSATRSAKSRTIAARTWTLRPLARWRVLLWCSCFVSHNSP